MGGRRRRWFFYVLRCADNSLYAGVTTDVSRRVTEHNQSRRGAKYTRSRRPVHLVYQRECRDQSEAQVNERGFKRLSKREKEGFINERQGFGVDP